MREFRLAHFTVWRGVRKKNPRINCSLWTDGLGILGGNLMLEFLSKVWQLARPYRWRFFLGVISGIISGAISPLLVATIMFVYGAIFPSGNSSTVYTMTNNVVVLPEMTLSAGASTSFTVHLASATNSENFKLEPFVTAPAGVKTILSGPLVNSNGLAYAVIVTNSGTAAISNILVSYALPTNAIFGGAAKSAQTLPIRGMPKFAEAWFQNVRSALESGLQTHRWAVVLLISAIPIIVFLRGFFAYVNVYFLQWVACRIVANMRMKLFAHIMDLSAGFFSETSTGVLISRVMNDTGMLGQILNNLVSVVIRDPITLITLMIFLLHQEPRLTLISMIVLPVAIIPIAVYSRKVRRATRDMQGRAAEATQIMTEAFTGHRVVKAYNLEKIVTDQFNASTTRGIGYYMRIIRAMELPGAFIEFFGSIGVALLLVYLITVKTQVHPNPTDFLALVASISMMYQPLKNLTRWQNQMVQARAAAGRAFKLLETQNLVVEPAKPKTLKAAAADIEFQNVHFAYGKKTAVENINLKIKAGQLVALVGASGSGKTTLSNLLLRFYDPQQGAIKIGGVDIREVVTGDLRGQMAVVTQETVLFNETIRRNIELGRPGATDDEIVAAAKSAHAHPFIIEKEKGYDTVIGEKGVMLSGGQRQRIAIARAVLRNAPILILDEATNALDTESERAVQIALDELMKGKTTLCIAHRLSTILHADVIVVLDGGRIVETGKHEDLVQRGGVYQKLYQLQFRE
ncbi:MAG TPA: ABC transporter ATP-binding protein [Verrucomicrobiae bacterium]|nr:ABC transporter ATP-binding protein [Verrucomicrobiae bacterium]